MLRSASRQRLRWDQNGHAGFDHPRSMRAAMLSVKSAPSGGWREYIAPDARQSARAASAIRLTVQTLYDEAGSERRCRPVELQQLRSEESPQSRELERQQAAARSLFPRRSGVGQPRRLAPGAVRLLAGLPWPYTVLQNARRAGGRIWRCPARVGGGRELGDGLGHHSVGRDGRVQVGQRNGADVDRRRGRRASAGGTGTT
mmetsp:Transcript_4176/g.13729  ORF Transcript_4176/g.13729 Transcript_4176/m.13729 type:complete len:201 (+) Transcript_4176:434-1036(+)